MDLESIAWVSRTRNRSVRQRLRHLSYQSSSEEESSSESVSTKSEIKPEAPSVAASENSVPDKPTTDDVSIIIIHGFNQRYYPRFNFDFDVHGMTVPGRKIYFDFKPQKIIGEGATDQGIKDVSTELLETVMKEAINTTLIFFAADIGGSVLKQALVEASCNTSYLPVLQSTALLIFSGTPHRPLPGYQWTYLLAKLFYEQSTDLPGPWLPSQLQRLSVLHANLAVNFDRLLEMNPPDILSYFQEESETDTYNLIVPRFAATLDHPAETQIGISTIHEFLTEFYTPKDQHLLTAKISDARHRRRPEYKEYICILSKYGLNVPRLQHSRAVYKALCDWIFSDIAFVRWLGSTPVPDQKCSDLDVLSKPARDYISRALIILELDGNIRETSILTSSLIASIRSARAEATDQFATLAHHHPQPLPLSKAQLMASLSCQMLISCPALINDILPMYNSTVKAIREHNAARKEACLWKLLRALFLGKTLAQIFVIIHLPTDAKFQTPFLELIKDLTTLVKSTEIHTKIIVLQKQSTTTNQDYPLLRKDIHHDDSEVRSALEKDFTEELGWMCSNKPQIVGPQAKVVKLLQGAVDLHLSKICLAMIQQQVCFSLKLLKGVLMARSNKELASLLLSLIPNAYQSWVQLGLAWATSAIRPLTRREFAEVLLLPDGSGGCMESLDSPVDEFTRLLSGLVEVEADTIHIANLELCKHLLYLIQETAGTTDFDPRTKRGDQGGPQFLDSERFQSQVHLDITQRCLAYLSRHKGIQVAGNSESNLRHSDHSDMEDSKAPLLQYAVEHWFTHLKLSQNSKVLTELTAVVDFIQDKNQVHQWMKLRTTYWKSRQDSGQSYSPSLKLLAEMISLQTSNNVDMIQAIELALDVSIIVKGPARNPWHYLVLAAAQRGQTDVLRRLIDKGCLEDESTLEAVFETGCEGMLCNLLPIIKTKGIRHNIQNIIYRAILSGSYALVCGLQAEFRDSINLANYETPLLNLIAENAGTNPPDSLLKDLRSGLNSIVRGGTVLHAAASSGHVDLMPILLSTISEPEVKVNCQDTSQSSPLHLATKNGHFIVVEQLLAAGSDVRLRDKAGQTSLHLASANGYTDIANALVEHKASISSEDKKSRTPLHMALECGHRELCLMLINKLATSSSERDAFDLDSRDSKGLTLLLLAVSSNFLAAVRSLLELGVDANTACAKGTPPLIYAAKCGFYDIVVELLGAPGIVVEARENNSNTPLHYAAFRNSPLVIGKLKEHGAKCGTQNSSGRTPLASACMRDHVAAVKTLLPGVSPEDLGIPYYTTSMFASFKVLHLVLNAGVDIDSNWDHVGTALHIASYNSQPRTVELLLLRGADFEQRDSNGRTPLMDAIMQNSIECVRLLVNARASLKVEDNDGYTPLLHAASRDHLDCIQILFEAKAEFNIPAGISSDYAMPMDLALLICPIKSFEMVIDHLLARSSSLSLSPDTLLKYLAEEGCDVNKIKILLERVSTWDPNATIGSYGTMLHYAALWGRLDLTKLLIDSKRVQIDANTKSYGTPLEVASGQGFNPDIVHLLLERGASITSGSVLTGTPLHAASSMSKRWEEKAEEKYLTIAKAILDYDISGLNIVAGFYGTPLCAAASSGTIAMVETLLEYRPDCELQGTASGTALHVAARKGRAKVVELLLGYMSPGLSPETTDTVGHIPIHMAASGGHTDLIGVLAKPEAILLARDFEERHSLHFAAGTGSLDFVRHILTQHPEAVNDVDCDGWSPLHWACRQRSTDVVKLLLDKRADKFAKTKKGWLPMHVAIYHGFKTIAQIVETSTMDNGECKPQHASEVELANEQEMMPPKTQFIARSERYANFTCDSCYCIIYGPRRCCNCHGFDMCFKCFRQGASVLLKGHQVDLFTPSGDILSTLVDGLETRE